ncbi:hypothetical protein RhiXN_11387 [Rhizoctonia solani]|uniref:Uncharacterized protein n=1 Tax=Rhizoctonia solani TaxID=456999 RepID=A0A8H8P3D7_9AGAM|nr:uncharacterized protein RhiXN_11387 [Rhizoctonia solani]QRW24475.1 hypothetical protein RhiXN_11387 [Rhizoctonia solani]
MSGPSIAPYQWYNQAPPDVATLQRLQRIPYEMSKITIQQQAANYHGYTEHHTYHYVVPIEPGAPVTPYLPYVHSVPPIPNWSFPFSIEASYTFTPGSIGIPRKDCNEIGCYRGMVPHSLRLPIHNSKGIQVKPTSRIHAPDQPINIQKEYSEVECAQFQTQCAYNQASAQPEHRLTPMKFLRELQTLHIQGRSGKSSIGRFLIQGEEAPVTVWRPDWDGPFLVQHHLPNGDEDAISAAHIVGDIITWCPPPK